MIHIAAARQSDPHRTNQSLSHKLSNPFLDAAVYPTMACNCAFVGYSTWRREENGDANLSDEQVFVVRDGQAKFLDPCNDLADHSPDGLSWGYSCSGAAQLAIAILIEIFNDWERVQPIYQRFMDCFVTKIPQNTNWTADGSDLMAMALAIEVEKMGSPQKSATNSSATTTQSAQSCRQRQGGAGRNTGESRRKEENAPFLRALQAFKNAALELEKTWDGIDDSELEESPLFESYPFDQSFDDVVFDICDWVEKFDEWVKERDSPSLEPD